MTDDERPDLADLSRGPAYNLERDYRPLFAGAGCDFNVWVGKKAIGADVNLTERAAGRMWGANVRYAKRPRIFSKPIPIMTIEEAEEEMRRRLDDLLRETALGKDKSLEARTFVGAFPKPFKLPADVFAARLSGRQAARRGM